MSQMKDKNPTAFKSKVIEEEKSEEKAKQQQHITGCNCTRSNCLKKYCECYKAGIKCTENCRCRECKNLDEEFLHDESNKKFSTNKKSIFSF